VPSFSSSSQFAPGECEETKLFIKRLLYEAVNEEQVGFILRTPWLLIQEKKSPRGLDLNSWYKETVNPVPPFFPQVGDPLFVVIQFFTDGGTNSLFFEEKNLMVSNT
jgi:hypothetical protein